MPLLSSAHLYAASPQHLTSVTVRTGDTLWTLAARHTRPGGDVQETIDRIAGVNRLKGATIVPGERLRIPE